MAAPPSKQSPSNQKMHQSGSGEENRLKDPPPSSLPSPIVAAATSAASTASPVSVPPTYRSSETSESYVVAKQLLNADNFEEALTVIEEELMRTTEAIRASLGLGVATTDNADLESEIELHESLAPLHYLYGTTLLYSIEEAKDDGNDTGAMMTEAGAKASTTATPTVPPEGASPDPTNPWAHLSEPSGSAAAVPQANNEDAAANAEDIQIAWENLEAARTIVEKMLLQATTTNALSETEVAKLQLDLAQIHLREGDLQRINGNYTSAVGDYSSCLEILQRHNQTKDGANQVRNLDRKIADTQFNLGLTYLTSSSDLQKEVASVDAKNESGGNESGPADVDHRKKAALLAREHCQKGIQQHVDCAKTFCEILAKLCGVDPETILSSSKAIDEDSGASKRPAGFKTTGLDDEEAGAASNTASATAAVASQTLNVWRMAVSTLLNSHTPSNADDASRVSDIRQLLDEIQETVDEAERSQEGVFQAAQIKVKAQQAAAALGREDGPASEVANADGSTTTIGFGQSASSIAASVAASEAGKAGESAAKPMMVVKKKKKRKEVGTSAVEGGESKKESEEGDANKRAKTV